MKEDAPLFTKASIEKLLAAKERHEPTVTLSIDLGKSETAATFAEDFTRLSFGTRGELRLDKLRKLNDQTIYFVDENGMLAPLHFFSEETQRVYKLIPTSDWPSFTISSTPMHQITFSSPRADTEAKVGLLGSASPKIRCLDTCFGMGYSAAEASKYFEQVISYEIDPNVIELARCNPYSREIFENTKIDLRIGDVFAEIRSLDPLSCSAITHDPPTFRYAPDLYSLDFYIELYRVLDERGLLFHYCPRPQIKKKQRDFTKEVKKRLLDAGFTVRQYSEAAQGLLLAKR